jgi:hypothetical protein
MAGTLIKIRRSNSTDVLAIVIKHAQDPRYWRALGLNSHHGQWFEIRLGSKYVEVISESR